MIPNDDAPLTPLQICLCCGYSLAGLPDVHQCPECGLPFSPRSFAIEVKPTQKPFSTVIWLVGCSAWGLMMVRTAPNLEFSLLTGISVVCGAAYQMFVGRYGQRLIVDERGLHLASRGRVQTSVAWEEITGFHFSGIHGGLLVRQRNGRTITLCRDPKIAKACRKDLESALADYG